MENNTVRVERRRGKFNIIDALVIVVVLLLAALVLRLIDPLGFFEDASEREAVLRYTVLFESVDDSLAAAVREGDSATGSPEGGYMGSVKSVEVGKAVRWAVSESTGMMEAIEVDGKSDIRVEIEIECIWRDGVGYITAADGTQLACGEDMSLAFPELSANGVCVALYEIGGGENE